MNANFKVCESSGKSNSWPFALVPSGLHVRRPTTQVRTLKDQHYSAANMCSKVRPVVAASTLSHFPSF